MPPSAPIPQQQQATERDGVASSLSIRSQECIEDDDKWNRSKILAEHDELMNRELPIQQPAVTSLAPSSSNPTTTTTQQQLMPPPIPVDTGLNYNNNNNNNNLWNPNSMLGMNSYNSFNPMNPSTSMYGNYGGMNNMNSMMMMPPLPMVGGGGPFSTITNYLLGIQNVIMSIGQVVQIISFNASSLQQLCESMLAMFEHAVKSWQEQQQLLLVNRTLTTNDMDHPTISPEEQQRVKRQQRRLRALRYTITMAMSYIGYTIIRKLFSDQRRQRYLPESEGSQRYNNAANSHHLTPAYPPVTVPYHHATNTGTYWNTPLAPQHLSPPYHHHPYYNNTGSFQ